MLHRYVIVGLLNTAVGLAVILMMLLLGSGDYPANATGYAVGLVLSYFLNRRWVFAAKASPSLAEAVRFGLCAGTSYAANLAVIYFARSIGHEDQAIAHLCAMAVYSLAFFVISRAFVFRTAASS